MAKSKYTYEQIEELLDKIFELPSNEELSKMIVDKLLLRLNVDEAYEEPDDENPPEIELQQKVEEWGRDYTMLLKRLRGPRGFNGSADNLVTMSESAYERLHVPDPNKYYFLYEGDEPQPSDAYLDENGILHVDGYIDENNILVITGEIDNNILTL